MEKTHWQQSPNKNYLGHPDLPNGEDLVLTIKSAKWEDVKNPKSNTVENKRVIRWKENVKPMICNETNAATIVSVTGIKFMDDSNDARIQLYVAQIVDKKTKNKIDCIRIRNFKPNALDKKELFPNSKEWDNALDKKISLSKVKEFYTISKENEANYIKEL